MPSEPDAPVLHQLQRSWATDSAVLAPDAPERLRALEADFLLSRWSEEHRRYHTVQHLAEVLAAIDELAAADEADPVSTRLAHVAGWYHDVFYDPQAAQGSNEHRSATMARDHLNALGVARGNVDVVEALVTMTSDHDVDRVPGRMASWRHTASVFHDADLWILSAPPSRYREYAEQVRSEYALVPTALFAQGRARILSRFLSRDAVYRTEHAREQWEPTARVNVAGELDRWRA
jgi:predicted metal-dependent HD superfamily phosphohydrolase